MNRISIRLAYLLSLSLSAACITRHADCDLTVAKIFGRNYGKTFVTDRINDTILQIRDRGTDSLTGGEYSLYKDGVLKSYRFFATENAYTYDEEYDESGRNVKRLGSLLVKAKIKKIHKDSVKFELHYFSLNKIYQSLRVSIDGTIKYNLILSDDSLYSNMRFATFSLSTKGIKRIDVYLLTAYKDCRNKDEYSMDTISLLHKADTLSLLRKAP